MSDNGTNERCPFGLKLLHILCARRGLNKQELSFTLVYVQHKKLFDNTTKERHQFITVLLS